jgi:Co/Zn/Cd efflux system component
MSNESPSFSLKVWWSEKVSDNVKSLALSAVLFSTISLVQIVYGQKVNSIALMSDASAMCVDVSCYLAAIVAECIPSSKKTLKRRFEVTVSFASLGILLGLAVYYIYEASISIGDTMEIVSARHASVEMGNPVSNETYGRDSDGMATHGLRQAVAYLEGLNDVGVAGNRTANVPVKDGPNFNGGSSSTVRGILPCADVGPGDPCGGGDSASGGKVMLTLGLLGLVMDLTCLAYAFLKQYCRCCAAAEKNDEEENNVENKPENETEGGEKSLNTLAALAHVAADLIRSLATVIAASYILARAGWASSGADAIAGLIASITIALGSMYGLQLWLLDLSPAGLYAMRCLGNKEVSMVDLLEGEDIESMTGLLEQESDTEY